MSGRIVGISDLFTDLGALALLGTAVALYPASTVAWIVALGTLPLTLPDDDLVADIKAVVAELSTYG